MKRKQIIIGLIVALAIAVGVYVYLQNRNAKKAAEVPGGDGVSPGSTATPGINGDILTPIQAGTFPLRYGSRGKAVQILQVIAGVKPDGIWGPASDVAIRRMMKDATGKVPFAGNDSLVSLAEFSEYVLMGVKDQAWPLKQGSAGNYVKGLQVMLGVKIDGKFGPKTASALTAKIGHSTCSQADFETLVESMFK